MENDKTKLDNTRRMKGINFIDLDDQDYKETLKNTGRKLERPVAPAMLCKVRKWLQNMKLHLKRFQNRFMAVWWNESTRQRAESSKSKNDEHRIAGKGFTSMSHCNLVYKFISMPQATNILEAKAAVDEEWKKLETIPAWNLEISQVQTGGYSECTRRQKESPLCHIDGHMSLSKMRS